MSQGSLPADWIHRFTDPFAVLGVAVTADDQRVLKRNRILVKLVHPDRHIDSDPDTQGRASALFTKLVNPAYEQLGKERNRRDSLATLRARARDLSEREPPWQPKSESARKLLAHPAAGVDIFYEQAVTQLAEQQFAPLTQFERITVELGELNLVYLQLKLTEATASPERRTGLVPAPQAKPLEFMPARPKAEVDAESYDRRHYRRAQEYVRRSAWNEAIKELKDAIRLNPRQADYHALLGIAHLKRNVTADGTMARVHLKRALEIDPKHRLACKYAPAAGVNWTAVPQAQNGTGHAPQNGRTPQNGKHPQNGTSGKPHVESDSQPITRIGKDEIPQPSKARTEKSKSAKNKVPFWMFWVKR